MEKVRKAAAVYFVLQCVGVVAWWMLLLTVPESRLVFVLEGNRETSLMAFWLADAIFIAAGSLAAATLIRKRSKFAVAALWLVTGALSYATVYTFAFVMMSDRGWAGVVLMLPAMIWSGVFAIAVTVENDMFREARASSTNFVMLKTFVQIAVVWTLILVLIPYLISLVEWKLGIPNLEFAYQRPIAVVLFLAISSLGVWSAYVMSRVGKGTPLPLDHAPNFVVSGPYAFVRNPMAVSGIGQGLAVALFLGSPLVALYALTGSLIWQLVFRPLEEDDLGRRFGPAYFEYKKSVRCWIPNFRGFQASGGEPAVPTEAGVIEPVD